MRGLISYIFKDVRIWYIMFFFFLTAEIFSQGTLNLVASESQVIVTRTRCVVENFCFGRADKIYARRVKVFHASVHLLMHDPTSLRQTASAR